MYIIKKNLENVLCSCGDGSGLQIRLEKIKFNFILLTRTFKGVGWCKVKFALFSLKAQWLFFSPELQI